VKSNMNVCIRSISLDWDLFSTAIYLVSHYLPLWNVPSTIYFELHLVIPSSLMLLLCRTLEHNQAINKSSPSCYNPVHWYETGLWASPCNCSSDLHLQYTVHALLAELHVTLEHSFSTYNHTSHVRCVFGATYLLSCIGVIYQLIWSIHSLKASIWWCSTHLLLSKWAPEVKLIWHVPWLFICRW